MEYSFKIKNTIFRCIKGFTPLHCCMTMHNFKGNIRIIKKYKIKNLIKKDIFA